MAIEGYGGGGFRIAGKRLTGSLVLLPDRILAWPVTSLAELTPASLDCVAAVADDVEFLLLGLRHGRTVGAERGTRCHAGAPCRHRCHGNRCRLPHLQHPDR